VYARDNPRNKSTDRKAFDCRARFLACGFVAATNLFSLDECRGRSVAKKGPSPLASIRQVFYIGLMRNCRGSPVNSCQCGISFVLVVLVAPTRATIHGETRRFGNLRIFNDASDAGEARCALLTAGINSLGLSTRERGERGDSLAYA